MFLIAGASSGPGQIVTRRLLDRGLPTRVLVRSDEHAKLFGGLGAEVVQGDVGDSATLDRACAGARVVVSLVGRHFAATESHLWSVDALGNERLIRAAERAGATRFVLLSALWAERDYPPFLLRAKRHAEQALQATSMEHAILRPSTFTTGASSLIGAVGPTVERWGLAFVPSPDSGPISFITLRDVAESIVAAALDPRPRLVAELGGPEAIGLGAGAQRIGTLLKKKVRVVGVPRIALAGARHAAKRRGFGAFEAVLFLEMLADHGYHCDPGPARELLGREPESVDGALRDYYATTTRTAWRDSNVGVLRSHAR